MAFVRNIRPHGGVIACVLLALTCVSSAAVPEYELKLAMTYNLARFVDWPSRASESEFVYCIAGDDPFDGAADELASRVVHGRPIVIKELRDGDLPRARCDLLFVADCDKGCAEDLSASLVGRPVLTIGDVPGFASGGGVIELENRANRIAFIINTDAYRKAGLVVSSQLLELATLLNESRVAEER